MKILLIANDINEESVHELATPFGLMYLSSYVRKFAGREIEITIVDGMADITGEEADIIGISTMSRYYGRAQELAQKVKERTGSPVVIGGRHITALPSTLGTHFDIGVLGEGEETFLELVRLWQEKKSFHPGDLAQIKNIAYRQNGEIVITSPRAPLSPLDTIPFPERSLWDLAGRVKYVVSSRGCPFGCVFCATGGSAHRYHSAEYVLEELQLIWEKYSPQVIVFLDDLFATSTERLRDISRGITESGLHRKAAFAVSLRADCITEERLRLLKEMNVFKIFMGIESGSENMIRYYKGNSISVKDVAHALDLCRNHYLKVEGSFIIGAPRETRDDLFSTYNFIVDNFKKGTLSGGAINMLTPYPGSQVWTYAQGRGLVSEDMDWSRLNLALNIFDPYTCVYLNETIPLEEFVDYIEFFEDLHFQISRRSYESLGNECEKLYSESRLDKERLHRFKAEREKTG